MEHTTHLPNDNTPAPDLALVIYGHGPDGRLTFASAVADLGGLFESPAETEAYLARGRRRRLPVSTPRRVRRIRERSLVA